jgi:hypothetical protein
MVFVTLLPILHLPSYSISSGQLPLFCGMTFICEIPEPLLAVPYVGCCSFLRDSTPGPDNT